MLLTDSHGGVRGVTEALRPEINDNVCRLGGRGHHGRLYVGPHGLTEGNNDGRCSETQHSKAGCRYSVFLSVGVGEQRNVCGRTDTTKIKVAGKNVGGSPISDGATVSAHDA
jgi:hypothetical protein